VIGTGESTIQLFFAGNLPPHMAARSVTGRPRCMRRGMYVVVYLFLGITCTVCVKTIPVIYYYDLVVFMVLLRILFLIVQQRKKSPLGVANAKRQPLFRSPSFLVTRPTPIQVKIIAVRSIDDRRFL
jgi:hypothetical protein